MFSNSFSDDFKQIGSLGIGQWIHNAFQTFNAFVKIFGGVGYCNCGVLDVLPILEFLRTETTRYHQHKHRDNGCNCNIKNESIVICEKVCHQTLKTLKSQLKVLHKVTQLVGKTKNSSLRNLCGIFIFNILIISCPSDYFKHFWIIFTIFCIYLIFNFLDSSRKFFLPSLKFYQHLLGLFFFLLFFLSLF